MAKLTPTQKAYQKEISNLRRRIRTAQKTGFVFDQIPIPTKPSRITKREIEKVKSLRGISLYEQATGFQSQHFGEFFSAAEVVRNLKAERARRAQITKRKKRLPPSRWEVDIGEQDSALRKLEDWINSWAPPVYQGKRGRNPYWEQVLATKTEAQETLREMLEEIRDRLAEAYTRLGDDYEFETGVSMNTWIDHQIAVRLVNSGVDIDGAIEGLNRSSSVEEVEFYVNPIYNALNGGAISIYDRIRLANATETADSTDYTDPDKFPL